MINKDRAFFQYNSGDLVSVIKPSQASYAQLQERSQ